MSDIEEKTIHLSDAELQAMMNSWKEAMTPQLIRAATDTAANILDNYAAAIAVATIETKSDEAKEGAEAAFALAAQLARNMANQVRNQPGG